ncbi:MAG: DUF5606 domain-containing protein [Saprospiraceae bacterium]|jgi:hypothetical protein|nr:DUF5606 domain-containing protein [Saprospiraceae bacterium]MDG1432402.1 DUF5606 domain-containing protein [Saprospiraceae bacterium]MDG2417891.1 DUF5606 domain-containing protein [Saprospiraceae bacterium]
MKLDDLVAVSGMSGVFKLAANRTNGLIIEDLDNGKRKFAPARKHQFTPLASIGIFTLDDSTELKIIFRTMVEQMESNPIPSSNSSSTELHIYFRKILSDYDEDKVHTSDIKKVIKWFNFLNERSLIDMKDESEETSDKSEEEE